MTLTATHTVERLPAAILTEADILRDAAQALQENERLRDALRANEQHLRTICRQYDKAAGTWGFQPHHLAQACRSRGML